MPQPLSKTKLSYFRKFLQRKTRASEKAFLIEGWHLLDEALKSGVKLRALIFDETAVRESAEDALLDRAITKCSEVYEASALQLSQISDTKAPQGVAALIESRGFCFESLVDSLPKEGPLRLIILDGLADPGNCGTIIRSSDWFGMDGVILGIGCSELENGKTVRASMGGIFHLPIAVGVDLGFAIESLKSIGMTCLTTELDGATSLADFEFPERAALVIGNEARGVSREVSDLADYRLFAPRFGAGESLNAASATAVFLTRWRM